MSALLIPLGLKAGNSANIASALSEVANEPHYARDTGELFVALDEQATPMPVKTRIENIINLLVGGKIDPDLLPKLAISDVYVVSSIDERNALTVQTGDSAIVITDAVDDDGNTITDDDGNAKKERDLYLYDGTQWQAVYTGASSAGGGTVDSVNNVMPTNGNISLTSDDVPEGDGNLYYTQGRVAAYIAGIVNKANGVAGLNSDGVLSIDVIPEAVVREGDYVGRLGTGDDAANTIYGSDGSGTLAKYTSINGGSY